MQSFLKKSTLLTGLLAFGLLHPVSAQNVTFNANHVTLKSAMAQVKKQTGYSFVFKNGAIANLKKVVNIHAKDAPVSQVVDKMLSGENVSYEIQGKTIIVYRKDGAQQVKQTHEGNKGTRIKVSGRILDSNGDPIIGATVKQKGSSNGTVSDVNGNFSFEAPEGSTLDVTYIGYQSQSLRAVAGREITISMKEDQESLNEVVVIGYGSQKKSDLTGGVVSVNEEKLNLVTTNNLMDRLVGQVPGLTITTGNAAPGQDQSIRIRGVNSLSASNTPLIVLDGIPYSGSLGDINPDMIESMSVLKDASAAAIYGSRGANGVILIQTKRGKVGKASVTYKGQIGFAETERRLNMMDGDEYIKYLQDYYHLKNGLDYSELTPEKILGADEYANYQAGKQTDWQDVVFRKGYVMNHELSISGGTESTTYIANISRLQQEGVEVHTGYKRTSANLNITQDLNKWLKIGMNMQAVEKDNNSRNPYLEAAIKMSPWSSAKDEDGNIIFYPMSRNTLYYNPVANSKGINDNNVRNIFISSFALIQLPLKGLSYRTNFGYNYRSTFAGSYYGRNTVSGKPVNGTASITNRHYYDYTWENILKYEREIGLHKFDATGLFSMQGTKNMYSSQSAENFVSDDYGYSNMNAGEDNISVSSSEVHTALLSYMFRLNYSFNSKYSVTLTGRTDGYSAFGKNNKYAFFPSGALAWNISQEKFMEGTRGWLDQLKLRLSYGANGNQAINAYQTLDRLSSTKYVYGDGVQASNGTYLPTNGVGNPNLKWETTYTFNAGLDYTLFNSRLFGSFDFYVSHTKDLLMSRSVPYMNGYRTIMDNIGKTKNIGFEITATSVNVRQKDFEWRTTVNLSWNKDEITKLTDNSKQDLTNKWFVGESSRVYYDYKVIGTWRSDDPRWDATQKKYLNADGKVIQAGAVPGSAMLQDTNGDGVINAKDKVIIGSKLPRVLASMTNNFNYKIFYASFVLNGLFGQWRSAHDYNFDRWMPEFNYLSDMNYWTEDNPTNSMTSPTYVPFSKHAFYKKMNYIQIKNVTLGVQLPTSFVRSIGLTAFRIDLSVNNLYTFSNIKNALNFDNTTDDEKGAVIGYPTARSYMLGVNITF